MGVRLQKYVEIYNLRLTLLYWIVRVCFLAGFMWHFWYSRLYAKQVDMAEYVRATLRVRGYNDAGSLRMAMNKALNQSAFCRSPKDYDYVWDTWSYVDHTCIPLCPQGQTSYDCFLKDEMVLQDSHPPSALVVTQITDVFTPSIYAMQESNSTNPKNTNYLAMSADTVSFSIAVELEAPGPGGILALADSDDRVRGSSSGRKGFIPLTIVGVHSDGSLWKTFQSSPSGINLSLKELLLLSGHPDLLDGQNDLAGENQLQGGRAGGPANRISGMELKVLVDCFNPYRPHLGDVPSAEDVAVCSLRVVKQTVAWVEQERQDHLPGGVRIRYYHGVKIVVQTGGIFEFIDHNKVYLNLVSLIVLLGLPTKLVRIMIMYMLGHMSVLYKRALCEDFNLQLVIAGMAARLMALSASFVQLEDVTKNGSEGISVRRMAERMDRVFGKRQELDETERIALVRFCFDQIVHAEWGSQRHEVKHTLKRIGQELGIVQIPTYDPSAHTIDLDHFSNACSFNDAVAFDSVVSLFDRHRRTTLLEHVFMPRTLWTEIHHRDEHKGHIAKRIHKTLEKERCEIFDKLEEGHGSHKGSEACLTDLLLQLEAMECRLSKLESRYSESGVCQTPADLSASCVQDVPQKARPAACSLAGSLVEDAPEGAMGHDKAQAEFCSKLCTTSATLYRALETLHQDHLAVKERLNSIERLLLRPAEQHLPATPRPTSTPSRQAATDDISSICRSSWCSPKGRAAATKIGLDANRRNRDESVERKGEQSLSRSPSAWRQSVSGTDGGAAAEDDGRIHNRHEGMLSHSGQNAE